MMNQASHILTWDIYLLETTFKPGNLVENNLQTVLYRELI